MSPALNRNSVLLHFEYSNAIEKRNGIMFDLYLGLPHIHIHILVPKSCATILEYSFIHAVLRTSLPHR